jgi:transposase
VSKARLVITAVVVEGRRPAEVAKAYGLSKSWVCELVARYRTEGDSAFGPRSRRPATRARQTPAETVELVVKLRHSLTRQGLDAGPVTIAWHLEQHHQIRLSRATIYRILRRADLVVAEPKKKPRSSYVRFQAEQPNETWQSGFTHWRLANGVDVEIITWLDDHARYALSVTAHLRITGRTVVDTFRAATEMHGIPFSTLTDSTVWCSPPASPKAASPPATASRPSSSDSVSARRTHDRTTRPPAGRSSASNRR